MGTSALSTWQADVSALGGVGTVWPATGPFAFEIDGVTPNPNVGLPAARFTAGQWAALAGTTDPGTGYEFPDTLPTADAMSNSENTLVYVTASGMTGDNSVSGSQAALEAAAATPTTAEDWAAFWPSLGLPPDFGATLTTYAKWGAVGIGTLILLDKF